jgi:arylsulfatase A-like enzyme
MFFPNKESRFIRMCRFGGRAFLMMLCSSCVSPDHSLAQAPNDKDSEYNVILITMTNVGASHMGLYGYDRETTPHIDRFAEESLVFDNFYTPASWTLPSGMSLFTSLPPYEHGVMNRGVFNTVNPVDVLPADTLSLIDVLKERGYVTVGFTGGFDYRPGMGLMNRFDRLLDTEMDDPMEGLVDEQLLEERRLGSIVDGTREALRWIDQHDGRKFFLFLQGYDAHCPFSPKGEFDRYFVDFDAGDVDVDPYHCYRKIDEREEVLTFTTGADESLPSGRKRVWGKTQLTEKDMRFLEAQYDAEVRYVDHYVGWFLEQIRQRKLLGKSIVIILSEHGEMFAGHGRFGRVGRYRGTLYEDVVRVPLIIRHPHWQPGRIKGLAQMIDVMPTLLDMLNMPRQEGLHGASLLPLIHEGKPVHQRIYGGSVYGRNEFKFYKLRTINEYVREREYKLIHEVVYAKGGVKEDSYELYHIPTDPREEKNLFDTEQEIAADLKERLQNWSGRWREKQDAAMKKVSPMPRDELR